MSENLYRFKYDEYGNTREIVVYASGSSACTCQYINKGTAFTKEEREALDLEGILPPGIRDLDTQIESATHKANNKVDDMERFIFFRALFDRNPTLAHALIKSDLERFIKIIYTPTVGLVVQKFSSMFRQVAGLHFYPGNIDKAEDILRAHIHRDIRVAVVTDNQGVMGIGDQGVGGIAVCLGKLMLYTQGAGIAPWHCLPISLDVGTNNERLLADRHYLGWRHKRLEGEEYLSFIGRFVRAFRNVFPSALCQWEDFSPQNAFPIRDAFVDEFISFNDDIQGTGAIALAAIYSAMKIKKEKLADQRFLIHGAGVGGVGIAEALVMALQEEGLSEEEALTRIFLVDARGLIGDDVNHEMYKRKFSKSTSRYPWTADLSATDIPKIIREGGVTVLLGTTGQDYFFNDETISEIKNNTSRPIILPIFQHVHAPATFCTNVERWNDEGILMATANPCGRMNELERAHNISQCHNALVFPGITLGVLVSGAREVLPEFFFAAAKEISKMVKPEALQQGRLLPSLLDMEKVASKVALATAKCAVEKGVSRQCVFSDFQHNNEEVRMEKLIEGIRWKPEYLPLVAM